MTAPQLYRVGEAAARLACHRDTVYALINKGELDTVRLGADLRISETALAKYVERNTDKRTRLRAS